MSVAVSMGQSERVAVYEVPDDQLAVGSTLGGPKAVCVIKANGALQQVYSTDLGARLFGTVILRHYDQKTGIYLGPQKGGKFTIHPEHQEHHFALAGNIAVREDIFVLSGEPGEDGSVDPPGVYLVIELTNTTSESVEIATYAFAEMQGKTARDIVAEWDSHLNAFIAWNESAPDQVRLFGSTTKPNSYETTLDVGKVVSLDCPGPLSGKTDAGLDPLGALHHTHSLEPDESARWAYLLSFGTGRAEAKKNYRACPTPDTALYRTRTYYHSVLRRAVVFTPNDVVNRGVLWAKANMLRILIQGPDGKWCFVNDPTRSVNSVGRDTAWFAHGADYIRPEFARDSLMAYVHNQEKNGLIVEYYNYRTGKTEDYGLNINDNTPLMILALWHHYNTNGSMDFLKEVYPAALKAARRILSQRNEQGLVWCSAKGTSDWGIVGWRNVITDYHLAGATTEVNSECYAALKTFSRMARVLEKHRESAKFMKEAEALKTAINTHLLNPGNGLYYLNIDTDGNPRSDVTSDLVFPVMYGVASEETAARIITRLSDKDFWTTAGLRTVPRDAYDYDPDGTSDGPYGLLGGVWVGVSFWFAFAAADHSPEFMDHALSASFRNYSMDPRGKNTVPGQFSEWLHGETLANQGMMLSPWFPPRYLWAAIEGAAGLILSEDNLSIRPRLAADWKWLGVRNLPYRGQMLAWVAVRAPDLQLYTTFPLSESGPSRFYDEDITDLVQATGESICVLGLRQGANILLFAGSTAMETTTTSLCVGLTDLQGSYRLRRYDSLLGKWRDDGLVSADKIQQGHVMQIERKGFCLLELTQEV
jgi:hypothetical protein